MRAGASPSALVVVLGQVGRERALVEARLDAALADIGREESGNRKLIEEGHRRLTALREVRREFEERMEATSLTMMLREWDAVRTGLKDDRERFLQRAALVRELAFAKDATLNAELSTADMAAVVEEYLQYQRSEPSLAEMPADYREAVLARHKRAMRRLAPYIAAAQGQPPEVAAPTVGVGVVASADPAEGRPEALVVVVPVPYAIFSDWRGREEDLSAQLAYRIVAAVFRLLSAVGARDAPVRYLEVHGCLGVQVWLGDHQVEGDLRERAMEYLSVVSEDGGELSAARVEVYTTWLRPELLSEDPT